MKDWFKSNRTVKNPAQAGDAVLAYYFGPTAEINTQERAPLDNSNFHGKYELQLWGISKGLIPISLLASGSFADSLCNMKFTEEEISLYSHFILVGKKSVTTYRLDHLDRSQIVTGYF
jgi:hypothetical protein